MATPIVNTPTDVDARLVARLKEGDLDALGPLYERHGAAVRTLLLRLDPAGDPATADDLCQETFLTFADGVDRYVHQGSLRSWLYGIAVRKAKGNRRRWWRRLGLRERAGAEASGVATHTYDTEAVLDARRKLDALLRRLPAPQRDALVLVHVEGLTVGEAAEVLGVSENAVSTRIYRARATLREER